MISEDHRELVEQLQVAEADWKTRRVELEANAKAKLAETIKKIAARTEEIKPERERLAKEREEKIKAAEEAVAKAKEKIDVKRSTNGPKTTKHRSSGSRWRLPVPRRRTRRS